MPVLGLRISRIAASIHGQLPASGVYGPIFGERHLARRLWPQLKNSSWLHTVYSAQWVASIIPVLGPKISLLQEKRELQTPKVYRVLFSVGAIELSYAGAWHDGWHHQEVNNIRDTELSAGAAVSVVSRAGAWHDDLYHLQVNK